MKPLMLLGNLVLCACTMQPAPNRPNLVARVTYYDKHEDHFGSKLATGGRAKEGITVAAPKVIPFFKEAVIPKLAGIVGTGAFRIEDRGSALEKAYRHGELRLDVYVSNRKKLNWLAAYMPEYMEAMIK